MNMNLKSSKGSSFMVVGKVIDNGTSGSMWIRHAVRKLSKVFFWKGRYIGVPSHAKKGTSTCKIDVRT